MQSLRSVCGVSQKNRCRNSDVRERCVLKEDEVTRVERDGELGDGRSSTVVDNKIVDALRHMIKTDQHITYHGNRAALGIEPRALDIRRFVEKVFFQRYYVMILAPSEAAARAGCPGLPPSNLGL
ncbi:hypothetical protein EVAR_26540_1 [Eumeta japonica]|uniref:Uncharacterized protein n=1 Tax=Eumeta variegata TaxID=151549 RepID=A0A4C1YRX6_EUMVA|nr:hypothetical protein EVAR_26540_1 [Eumeta japonica]